MADRDEYKDDKWVPEEALSALVMEADLHPEESHEARAKRLLTENVDVAAAGLIHIARNDPNSRLRLDAQKYIMERVLGRAGDAPATGTLDDLFTKLDKLNANAAAMSQAGISPTSAVDRYAASGNEGTDSSDE